MLCPPQPSPGSLAGQEKKRRACDECRNRKLACSKEPDGCRRCQREGLACIYSVQKTMGRPRKRPRNEAPVRSPAPGPATTSAPAAPPAEPEYACRGLGFLAEQEPFLFSSYDELLDPALTLSLPLPTGPFLDGSCLPPGRCTDVDTREAAVTGTEMAAMALCEAGETASCLDLQLQGQGQGQGQTVTPPATEATARSASPPARSVRLSTAALDIVAAAAGTVIYPVSNSGGNDWSSGGRPSSFDGIPGGLPDSNSSSSSSSTALGDDSNAYAQAAAAWLLTVPRRSCGCLTRLYLALDSLQHLPDEVDQAITVARNAAHTAHDTVQCVHCSPAAPEARTRVSPLSSPSSSSLSSPSLLPFNALNETPPPESFPNLMLLCALLPTLAHAYRRILLLVDAEAARAAAARQQLPLAVQTYGGVWGRMAAPWAAMTARARAQAGVQADAPTATAAAVLPLLTGRCMVEPALWRLVVRTLLKTDVYGIHQEEHGGPGCVVPDEDGDGGTMCGGLPIPLHHGLRDIVDMMEKRAQARLGTAAHAGGNTSAPSQPRTESAQRPHHYKHPCERVIQLARYEIERLVIV